MESPEDHPAPDGAVPEACQAARSGMAAFVGRTADRKSAAAFRDHVQDCEDCKALYQQTVDAAAMMGRHIREDRDERGKLLRKAGMAERAKKATGEPGRKNRYALRLALLPAAFALLLFLQRALKPEEGMTLHWQGGQVLVDGQRLNRDFPKRVLNEEGLYCLTKGNAHALIFAHSEPEEARFKLGLETIVQVLEPSELKLRLAVGELEINGPGSVLTQFGVVEVLEGKARLEVRDRRLRLECVSGELVLRTAAADEELSAGMKLERGG